MPRIDWSNIEENKGAGGIQTLPSGAYVCAVTGASYETSKKGDPMLTLLFDIADGPYRGFFSGDFFANKPFRHSDRLMLAGKGLGFTKHKLHCLADWNPGLKPTALIDTDQTAPFVGKRCCLLIQERKYTYNGRDQSEANVVGWLSPEEFRAGDFTVPETKDERNAAPAPVQAPVAAPVAPAPAPDLADEDIPF